MAGTRYSGAVNYSSPQPDSAEILENGLCSILVE